MSEQLDQVLGKLIEEVTKSICITNGNIESTIVSVKSAMPDLYDSVSRVIFYQCVGDTVIPMVFFIIAIFGICHSVRLHRKFKASDESTSDDEATVIFGFIGFSVMLAITSVFVLNIWNWIGLFDQKTWLIHEIGSRLL